MPRAWSIGQTLALTLHVRGPECLTHATIRVNCSIDSQIRCRRSLAAVFTAHRSSAASTHRLTSAQRVAFQAAYGARHPSA